MGTSMPVSFTSSTAISLPGLSPAAEVVIRAKVRRQELNYWITVRRANHGRKPFRWELRGADTAEPLQLSDDTYPTMDLAYRAGQSSLAGFIESLWKQPARGADEAA
jgi:hypothetical protein